MTQLLQRLPSLKRLSLLAIVLIFSLPQFAWAQEGANPPVEEGGGMLKTMVGYLLVIIGVGIGVAAVVYPPNLGAPKKPTKK